MDVLRVTLTLMTVGLLGVLMVVLLLNMLEGWDLAAQCKATEATDQLCKSAYWTTVVQYLPTWLIMAQFLVFMVHATPFALLGR